MGNNVLSYLPSIPTIADRIAKLNYNDDSLSHIKVLDPKVIL